MTAPEALLRDIQQALGRRDGAAALHLIDEALGQAPGDIDLRLQKAMALRLQGDLKGALAALDAALDAMTAFARAAGVCLLMCLWMYGIVLLLLLLCFK